jgi:hypothetical protein
MYANNFAKGPVTAHVQMQLAARLLDAFSATWEIRGWALEHGDNGWDVTGDTGQFYVDACANDANAAFAMAFLARFSPESYEGWKLEAADDFIDLDESLNVFLFEKTLEDALERVQ